MFSANNAYWLLSEVYLFTKIKLFVEKGKRNKIFFG